LKRGRPSDIFERIMARQEGEEVLRVASLDVGTNSLRLLVADWGAGGGLRRVFGDRRITRLGEGLQGSGRLSEEAIQRTLEALCVFLGEAEGLGAQRVLAAATSAVRDASNGPGFVRRVRGETGLDLRVLSGQEEASWMAAGVSLLWHTPPPEWVAVDIGGGSTEVVRASGRKASASRSIPLGMVRLTEEVFAHDPPTDEELKRARGVAREALAEPLRVLGAEGAGKGILVGTAGTVTTLAALDMGLERYDPDAINGYTLSTDSVERWCRTLAGLSRAERAGLPGMEPGRQDVIVAGAVMVGELLALLQAEGLLVSDYGLLEGIALAAALGEG
jgi:exopolyphosphatase/guanosine-5'-triphosphate,3'-diphosphate pyrophosphatase